MGEVTPALVFRAASAFRAVVVLGQRGQRRDAVARRQLAGVNPRTQDGVSGVRRYPHPGTARPLAPGAHLRPNRIASGHDGGDSRATPRAAVFFRALILQRHLREWVSGAVPWTAPSSTLLGLV